MPDEWPTRRIRVTTLQLDHQNPRLRTALDPLSQREILQYLFEHEDARDVAASILRHGYFSYDTLLVVEERGRPVVVEGNRRLAALKALRKPDLLEGAQRSRIERLLRNAGPVAIPDAVSVTVAPNRLATDPVLAERHVGSPVKRWSSENQASFILSRLDAGYDAEALHQRLGFTAAQVRDAREIRKLAEMARSLDLSEEQQARLREADPALITTLHRFVDSEAGRAALRLERDPDDVFRVRAAEARFRKGFTRVVTDLLEGTENSRTLNTHVDIERYVDSWPVDVKVPRAQRSFAIDRAIRPPAIPPEPDPQPQPRPRQPRVHSSVLPSSVRVVFGGTKLIHLRNELVGLQRERFPNAGGVTMRVFFELMVRDYFGRTGDLQRITEELRQKNRLPGHGQPEMQHLVPNIKKTARARLPKPEAEAVVRAIEQQKWLDDLNAFVHNPLVLPSPDDLLRFYTATAPLFRLMLETPTESGEASG